MKPKHKSTTNNREYKILIKTLVIYCPICNKRSGKFDAYCGPNPNTGRREYRTWKHTRKKQYK